MNKQPPNLEHANANDVDHIVALLERDGACIARDVLSVELCDALLADFNNALAEMPWGLDDLGYKDAFYGERTKRLHGLFSASPRMVDVLTHPLLTDLAHRLFVESGIAHDIRLSNTELMALGGGQANQAFHTDAASWSRVQTAESGEILVSANCALTDFTEANGSTRGVPGSHRWDPGRQPQNNEICLAVMPKGSALIYTGNAVHSGGANTTDSIRAGLYLGYIPSWLRPIENQLVTNKPEDVLALPEQARRLLDVVDGGFTVYA